MIAKIKGLFKALYFKLFKINDSPQKIALGLALGVFSGFTPGIGLLTALFLAFLLRANRASAILGTLLTNTWTSLLTFILSIKLGSAIMGVSWKEVYAPWMLLIKDFHLKGLFSLSVTQVILPVALGYLVVAAFFGIVAYLVTLLILFLRKKDEDKSRISLPR
ncbi:MAG: DUF2062 domain-containing protein [Candidatus Omnitrophica bacterium]|nr:DUF2062 domain-containing protein [Candidatus Omnitrophota bacterium]